MNLCELSFLREKCLMNLIHNLTICCLNILKHMGVFGVYRQFLQKKEKKKKKKKKKKERKKDWGVNYNMKKMRGIILARLPPT